MRARTLQMLMRRVSSFVMTISIKNLLSKSRGQPHEKGSTTVNYRFTRTYRCIC
jgi:hypothetical protein